MMKRYVHIAFAIVVGLAMAALFSCSKLNPLAPTAPKISSHEFTWMVDTIQSGNCQFVARTLWGTSDINMYLGGETCDECSLWKWNGRQWTGIKLIDNNLPDDLEKIDGVDSSFFVMIGNRPDHPMVVVYDHGKWKNIFSLQLRPWFWCIDVISKSEIYIAGADGVLRYDGSNWNWMLDSTNSLINGVFDFAPISLKKTNDGSIYFTSQRNHQGESDKVYFWKWIGNSFVPLDSFVLGAGTIRSRFGTMLYETGYNLYSANYGLFRLNGTRWNKMTPFGGRSITGTDNNLYVATFDSLYHYNGESWTDALPRALISMHPGLLIYDIRYSDNTIFVAISDGYRSFVLRGKQKII
jgi:hypothetical protein